MTQLHGHLEDTSIAADIWCIIVQSIRKWPLTVDTSDSGVSTDPLRCIIVQGIQHWFLNCDTNDPDSTDPIVQIG
jgi:hypothetical protein